MKERVQEADKKEHEEQKRLEDRDGKPTDATPADPVRQPSRPPNTPAGDLGTGEDLPGALLAPFNPLGADLNAFREDRRQDLPDLDPFMRHWNLNVEVDNSMIRLNFPPGQCRRSLTALFDYWCAANTLRAHGDHSQILTDKELLDFELRSWFANAPLVLLFQICRFGNQVTGIGARTWKRKDHIRFTDRLNMVPWTGPLQDSTYVLHSVIEQFGTMHDLAIKRRSNDAPPVVVHRYTGSGAHSREPSSDEVQRLFYLIVKEEEPLA
jgi:hypothetical protein